MKSLMGVCLVVVFLGSSAHGYYETFTYPDGPLAGNDGWTAGGPAQHVLNQKAAVVYDGTLAGYTADVSVSIDPDGSGVWSAGLKVQSIATSGNFWGILFEDAAGKNFARWYGGANTARPRIGPYGQVLPGQALTGGWDELRVVIDTVAQTSTFYFNGANLGFLTYATNQPTIGTSLATIRIEQQGNVGTTAVPQGTTIYLDDLWAMSGVPEPAALALFALPAVLAMLRRRR